MSFYQCDRSRSLQQLRDGPIAFYTLPDGRCFFSLHGFGWCPRCRLLAEVEWVPTSEALRQELFWLRRFDSDADYLEYVATLLDWSRMRKQPAHCLACGAQDFISLKEGKGHLLEFVEQIARPFRHPGCGGVFRCASDEITFSQPVAKCLTVDGEPVDYRWAGPLRRRLRRAGCWILGHLPGVHRLL
jgi:hypothetical protein